jgi:hypothetical protein
VLTLERQLLCEDHDVVGEQRELEPRRVSGEGVEGHVRGTGGLQRLAAILDRGVGAMQDLQGGDLLPVLVGDEASEAEPVEI